MKSKTWTSLKSLEINVYITHKGGKYETQHAETENTISVCWIFKGSICGVCSLKHMSALSSSERMFSSVCVVLKITKPGVHLSNICSTEMYRTYLILRVNLGIMKSTSIFSLVAKNSQKNSCSMNILFFPHNLSHVLLILQRKSTYMYRTTTTEK